VLATVMLVSMLVGSLSALALATGRQADTSSTSDRNHDQSLAAAEAGVHEAIVQFGQRAAAGNTQPFSIATSTPPPVPSIPSGTTTTCPTSSPNPLASAAYPLGVYYVCFTKDATTGYYWIDSEGSVGGQHFGRKRHVRVQLVPPNIFPNNGKYALFSYTDIALKDNDTVDGSVWANQSFTFANNSTVNGNVTAATSWIDISANGAKLNGDALSGGYNSGGWAINIGSNPLTGSVRAASSVPSCQGETASNYNIAGSGAISGAVTTFGSMPSGTHGTPYAPNTCTPAPAAEPMPAFTFNKANYGCTLSGPTWTCPSTYHEFSSVSAFQTWLSGNSGTVQGTFWVNDPAPSESNRIDLSGAQVVGTTTIVTNAPVFTNGIGDSGGAASQTFTVVSHYTPPVNSSCDYNHDSSECAIHIKNNFDTSCKTAVLIYADNGPVAIKNNQLMCGSVVGNGMIIKNNQNLNFDGRVQRMFGFGPDAFEVGSWQEYTAS
jgi:hypothetical protein